jgi:SAM-dependent methyltransferase
VSSIHPTAAKGFVRPDVYERGRPGYPAAIVGAMGIGVATKVIELGCGTGKCTRLLHDAGADVLGIEPLAGMLDTFKAVLPDVSAVAGTAEAIPVRSDAAGAVVCASAFHWFDHAQAIPEIARVLAPDGSLHIVWNRRDELSGWAAEFWAITEAHRGDTPGYRTNRWRDALEGSGRFGPLTEAWFEHSQRTDVEGLLARVGSISFIETLPEAQRRQVLVDAKAFLDEHPDTRGRAELELPYRTVVYSARVS